MLTKEELDAIRSRTEAAKGPCELVIRNDGSDFADFEHLAHATFIAHARTDVPALLDTIAEARAELVKHFDDIDVDYDGEPNELDTMVRQAAGQLHESRSWSGKETERANVAEHKNSQLRSRFALELAAHTTPDTAESQRQANRITELEDVGKDNQYIVETLARALGVDPAAHRITELVHAAADRIENLKEACGGLRAWQDVARPKLEARFAELEAAQVPRDMADAPRCGAWVIIQLDANSIGHPFAVLQFRRGEWYDPSGSPYVEDADLIGWLPLPDQQSGVVK